MNNSQYKCMFLFVQSHVMTHENNVCWKFFGHKIWNCHHQFQVHGNVCVTSVVVTQTLDWKLHAFDVLSEFDANNEASNSPMLVWSLNHSPAPLYIDIELLQLSFGHVWWMYWNKCFYTVLVMLSYVEFPLFLESKNWYSLISGKFNMIEGDIYHTSFYILMFLCSNLNG